MKIQDILTEDFAANNKPDLYEKLTNQHIAGLRWAYQGKLPEFEEASDTQKRIMGQLASYGLLTDYDYTITDEGMGILRRANNDASRMPRRAQSSSWSHNGGAEDAMVDAADELGARGVPLNGKVSTIGGRVNREGSI